MKRKKRKKLTVQPQSKADKKQEIFIDRQSATNLSRYALKLKLQHILSIFLILLISIAIYSNTLKNGFVYDDETTIVNNTMI